MNAYTTPINQDVNYRFLEIIPNKNMRIHAPAFQGIGALS